MRTNNSLWLAGVLVVALAVNSSGAPDKPGRTKAPTPSAPAVPAETNGSANGGEDAGADRLVKSAEELITAKETERGVRMLETVIERFPESPVRFKAFLALGRHYVDAHKHQDALKYLRQLASLERPDEPLKGDVKEIYLEGLYLTGVAYYQSGQYAAAFPVLRKITRDYPNTIWANQSYYYIGMCHFAQGNWQKSIEALTLVGTFVDPNSPTIQYIEAGRRFYIKLDDADLPILTSLGKETTVKLETAQGDKESVQCIPLAGKGELCIGSIATEVGPVKSADNILQVIGGDSIKVTYADNNTQDGEKDVARSATVKVVATGSLAFTLGTFEAKAVAAFLNQPLFVLLEDADLDKTPERDTFAIKIVARYRDLEAEQAARDEAGSLEKLMQAGDEIRRYKTRDEVLLTLKELGTEPVRTGRFAGKVELVAARDGGAGTGQDGQLQCVTGDEILAVYVDERHISGEAPREVQTAMIVAGEIENRPMATQYVVADPVVRAKKNAVEAMAYLELGRIFKSMGLNKGAAERCDLGLVQADAIIRSQQAIPVAQTEEGFRLKWELQMVKEDFDGAIATCQLFSKLFPKSPIVDQALLGIGKIHLERKDYAKAKGVFQQVIALPNSMAKAEAQFRIAETVEAENQPAAGRPGNPAAAIPFYKLCAERYPDSEFAGSSLGKLIDYYVETKDYTTADDLLNQIFQDHPDAAFLDSMLLKWVIVSFRMGNYQRAHDKCTQLLFEYPESRFAEKAKGLLPRIEEKVKAPGSTPAAPADKTTTPTEG
jgi:TolA-binding protein